MNEITSVLTDAATLRGKIHQKVTGALTAAFPLDLKGRTLEVKDVKVHERDYSSDEQKRALLSGSSLENVVKGTLVLKGSDGRTIDETKNFTLTHIPYITDRHTFIAGGNEFQFANQIRRKPGVYTQRAANGELRTVFNLGKGYNFDLGFNEKKGTFYLQYGTSNIPMYAALRGIGVTHDEIAKHIGEGVAKENQKEHGHQIDSAVNKLYQKLEHPSRYDAKAPTAAKAEVIRRQYNNSSLDPHVTSFTLGHPHDKVTPTVLLDAAKKLLAVHTGKTSVDDTDSLAFKTFLSADDFLAERIRLTARTWAPKARMALAGKTNIRDAVRPAPFSDSIRKWVTTSSLTAVPSGINPLELLDHAVKVTALGEGGIPSDRAIPLDARMTHSTHFGALDPIRTPESNHAGVDVRATIAAHRDDHGNLYTAMRDAKTGKQVFLRAGDLLNHVVAFPHQDLKGTVKAFVKGEVQNVPGSKVTHEMMHVSHQYSPATSLIPMIHNIQGNRAIMGSKMGTQALPLLDREVPYVQVKSHLPGEVSFESIYGHMTVPTSPVHGTVEKIENGYIYIRPHGEKKAEDRPVIEHRKLGPFQFAIEIKKGVAHTAEGKTTSHGSSEDYGHLPGYVGPDGDSLDFFVGHDPHGAIFSYEKQKKLNAQGELHPDAPWQHTDTKYVVGLGPKDAAEFHKNTEAWNSPMIRFANLKHFKDWNHLQQHIDEHFKNEKNAWDARHVGAALGALGGAAGGVLSADDDATTSQKALRAAGGALLGGGVGYGAGHLIHRRPGAPVGNPAAGPAVPPSAGRVAPPAGAEPKIAPFGIALKTRGPSIDYHRIMDKGFNDQGYRAFSGAVDHDDLGAVLHGTPHDFSVVFHGLPSNRKDSSERVIRNNIYLSGGTGFEERELAKRLATIWSSPEGRKALQAKLDSSFTAPFVENAIRTSGTPGHDHDFYAKTLHDAVHAVDVGVLPAPTEDRKRYLDAFDDFFAGKHDAVSANFSDRPYSANEKYFPAGRHVHYDPAGNNFRIFNNAAKTSAAKDEKGLIKVPYETNFPFPSKTYLHHDIQVKPGQTVQAGQRLGDSNFTRNGTLALGKNLLVGYMPYHGLNSNDAVVISEGCAQKLTSEHMYREVYPLSSELELSKNKHKTFYGNKYTPQQYAKIDDSGVIKQGARVDPKDPLVLGLTKAQIQGVDLMLGRLSKSLTRPYREVVLQWEHGTPGEVVEVFRSASQIAILVKTHERMNVGDKLAGRYGNKGVVAKIVPDHEMIQDEKGRPLDLILTSAGVVSRINPAQIIETAVGKVVEKTGKPILYDNAEEKNAVKWARDMLQKHGIKDKEHVYDPIQKRKITGPDGKGVLVGRQFIYKLFKSTDTNFSGHGVGPYDVNEQPLKTGGDESAKGIGKMEFDALMAHNARNFLQEAATVKGQKNDEFWRAIQLGAPLPTPKTSFAFNKFTAMLEGSGVRVEKRGSKFKLLPMTDQDVLARSRGAIENKKTLIAKNLKPEAGGLFDPNKTGGPQGTLYSHIDLHESVPHPVFVEPIRRLLNLSQKDFEQKLQDHGGKWFHGELSKIDIDHRLTELRAKMAKATGPDLDDTVKQIKYLTALKTEKIKPQDAYLISKVPVIPPVFRPILPEKRDPSQLMVADANKLYAHLIDTNDVLKTTALQSDMGKHRNLVYKAVGAVFGMNAPEDEKLQKQEVKGFLQNIAGVGTPKGGFFQRKLMRRTQDISGRGTAVPDGNLGMDEVGIPEQMLWQMLDKLIVARLVRQGYSALTAREMVDKKQPAAREAMLAESRERPVLINRAPTLHRWSIVAAYPKPVQGKTIRVNPFIEKGMNLDYDGDTLQVHAPVQRGAVEDAKKMTLSQMLLSDQQRNKLMAFPQHEAIIGFTLASKATSGTAPAHHFKTRDEAMAAWRSGKLKLTDSIVIDQEKHAAFDEPVYLDDLDGVTTEEALSYYPAESVTGHETDPG
jgi:DNA-directed RNA polymerase beta subunit